MAKLRDVRFELAENSAYPGIKGVALIIGTIPNDQPYLSIHFENKKGQLVHGWMKDKDLERFAVNILKALGSKKLAPIQKAKEIIDAYGNYLVKEFKNEPSVDKWLATPEAAALLSGEDLVSEVDKARFWIKVKLDQHGYCWEWTGYRNKDGYGVFRTSNDPESAHRIAYQIINGKIADNLQVLHKCDNPCCVNPDHLFTGTHTDNMRDKSRKGRAKILGRSSKFFGVSLRNDNNKWRATIKSNGESIRLGCFDTQELAAQAYDSEVKNRKLDLPLNFPLPEPPKP